MVVCEQRIASVKFSGWVVFTFFAHVLSMMFAGNRMVFTDMISLPKHLNYQAGYTKGYTTGFTVCVMLVHASGGRAFSCLRGLLLWPRLI